MPRATACVVAWAEPHGLQSGMQSGLQAGLQSRLQPGMQSGLQAGLQPYAGRWSACRCR